MLCCYFAGEQQRDPACISYVGSCVMQVHIFADLRHAESMPDDGSRVLDSCVFSTPDGAVVSTVPAKARPMFDNPVYYTGYRVICPSPFEGSSLNPSSVWAGLGLNGHSPRPSHPRDCGESCCFPSAWPHPSGRLVAEWLRRSQIAWPRSWHCCWRVRRCRPQQPCSPAVPAAFAQVPLERRAEVGCCLGTMYGGLELQSQLWEWTRHMQGLQVYHFHVYYTRRNVRFEADTLLSVWKRPEDAQPSQMLPGVEWVQVDTFDKDFR